MDAHEPCVPVDDAPRVDGHAQACPGDLAVTGPAPELRGQLDHLRQAGGPERMAAADEAAARIDDQTGESMPVSPASVAGPASPGAKNPRDSRA